jgi:hypothetical protein
VDLTKYIVEKPPNRELVRYLDAEMRKIQRSLDSILAWKASLEVITGEQEYLIAKRFIAIRSEGSGAGGVPVPNDFFHAINTVGGAGRKAGIDFQVGYPVATWQTAMWTEQNNWWHAFGANDFVAVWGFDGNRVRRADETWTSATLLNSWVAYDSTTPTTTQWGTLQYLKDACGFVHLRGLIRSGTTTPGTTVAVLPAGFRPGTNTLFPVRTAAGADDRTGRCDIYSNGNVTIQGNIGADYLSFNGITFLAEA